MKRGWLTAGMFLVFAGVPGVVAGQAPPPVPAGPPLPVILPPRDNPFDPLDNRRSGHGPGLPSIDGAGLRMPPGHEGGRRIDPVFRKPAAKPVAKPAAKPDAGIKPAGDEGNH